jgi:hypothetical protein
MDTQGTENMGMSYSTGSGWTDRTHEGRTWVSGVEDTHSAEPLGEAFSQEGSSVDVFPLSSYQAWILKNSSKSSCQCLMLWRRLHTTISWLRGSSGS